MNKISEREGVRKQNTEGSGYKNNENLKLTFEVATFLTI